MPVEPRIDVLGDPDVVTRAIGVASDDVDDALLESVHGRNGCESCADSKGEEIETSGRADTQVPRASNGSERAGSAMRGQPSPVRWLAWGSAGEERTLTQPAWPKLSVVRGRLVRSAAAPPGLRRDSLRLSGDPRAPGG